MPSLGATEFSELVAATLRNLGTKQTTDNVMTQHPTLDFLKGQIGAAGGRALFVPLTLDTDNSTSITDASGTFSQAVSNDLLGGGEYAWSDPIVSHVRLIWKRIEENMASGTKLTDLVKAHVEGALYAHGRQLVRYLHAVDRPGVGNTFTAGQFLSLDRLVSDAAYDANPTGAIAGSEVPFTVGGINATTQPLWQAQRIELPLDSTVFGSIRKAFRYVRNEIAVATSNRSNPNILICGRDIFEEYEDSYDDKVRYTEFGEGQSQFREIRDGEAYVRLDPDCPSRRAYFIDPKSLHFKHLNSNFMRGMDPQDIQGTLDKVTPAVSVLATGVNERRANAVLLRPTTAGGLA